MFLSDFFTTIFSPLFDYSEDREHLPWKGFADKDIDRLLTKRSRRELVSDCRIIFQRNGDVSAMCFDKANACVGNAWLPIFKGENADWGRSTVATLLQWMKVCDMRGQPFDWNNDLWLGSLCLERDGDYFINFVLNDIGYPLLQFIETHRIGTPPGTSKQDGYYEVVIKGPYAGMQIQQGVIRNPVTKRPLAYWYLADRPEDDYTLPASQVAHIFDPVWFSQSRGVPHISYGLLDFLESYEIRSAEKRGVLANSSIAMIEENETGKQDAAEARKARGDKAQGGFSVQTVAKGLIRHFKAGTGTKLTAHLANRPGPTHIPFNEAILRGAFNGAGWPYEWARDMGGLKGPGVRAMGRRVQDTIINRQAVLGMHAQRSIVHAVGALMKLGVIPWEDDWYMWDFSLPTDLSIDAGYNSTAALNEHRAGWTTLQQILTQRGQPDWKAHVDQRITEAAYIIKGCEAKGVPLAMIQDLTTQGVPVTGEEEEDPEETPPGNGNGDGEEEEEEKKTKKK